MRRMLNNFEMRIFRRDVRHIYTYIDIEKISIEHTSVGLASARPNNWGEPERAPHRRVECSQSIYYVCIYFGTSVTRAPPYTLYAVRDIFRRPHEETSALSGIPRA